MAKIKTSNRTKKKTALVRDGRGQMTGLLRIVKVGGKTVRLWNTEGWAKFLARVKE